MCMSMKGIMASPISSATRTASSKDASFARDDDAKLVPPSRWMFINTKTEERSPRPSLAPPLLPQHRRELQPSTTTTAVAAAPAASSASSSASWPSLP